MDRPDTMVEIHRQRVQDLTLEFFSSEKYSQPADGPGFSATATLDVTLDRVWFVQDARGRIWQEADGDQRRDPLRHFAIDLRIFDSKLSIDSVTCIPLVELPPRTVTIPDGPRAGESRQIPYNEIPLFGHLTIHEQLQCHETEPGKQTIALNFTEQDAPPLIAPATGGARLFGPAAERHTNGDTVFGGPDPRVTWDLDDAEAYWITHCIAGELLVNLEKLRHPTTSDDDARNAVLDFIAAQIADAVRPEVAALGEDGVVGILPEAIDVDPTVDDDGTVKDLDAVVQRWEAGGQPHESVAVQLRTLRNLPPGEQLPPSVLAENPDEHTALAVTGWSVLRQVRDTVQSTFNLSESDFDPDAPCLLDGPKTVTIGGDERVLEALDADIVPRTGHGRLVVDGKVNAHTKFYDFDAAFTITYDMVLDDIPADDEEMEKLQRALREAEDREAEVKRVNERIAELPRTIGVRPEQPAKPVVTPNFGLTVAGHAASAVGAAALVGLLALPVTAAAGGAAAVGAAGAGGLLAFAIVDYLSTVLTVGWFGTGVGSREVRKALSDRPAGTELPTVGIPVCANLNRQRLAVYFRQVPPRLSVSCVETDDNGVVRLVGGRWPGDGVPWKLSADDARRFVEAGELELLFEGSGEPVGLRSDRA